MPYPDIEFFSFFFAKKNQKDFICFLMSTPFSGVPEKTIKVFLLLFLQKKKIKNLEKRQNTHTESFDPKRKEPLEGSPS